MEPHPPTGPGSQPPPPPPRLPSDAKQPAGDARVQVCPVCSLVREPDARYCEECGYDFDSAPAAPEDVPPSKTPLLWIIVAIWALLMIGGLIFLYTSIWTA